MDEREQEQSKGPGSSPVRNADQLPGHTSLTTEERPSETHNTVSSPDGDDAAENRVSTSLGDD